MSYAHTNIDHTACPAPALQQSWIARLAFWVHCARSRRDLRALDPHLLRDIGITDAEAKSEADRPFWDAPNHWHN